MKVVAHEATAALSHGLKVAVVLIIDALYTVGQRKEILNFCHIGLGGFYPKCPILTNDET